MKTGNVPIINIESHRFGCDIAVQPMFQGAFFLASSTTSTDQSAFSDQTPIYNSGIIGNYINYLEFHHVDLDTDELLRRSGLTRFDINDEGHFLNQEQINRFHRCLDEALKDPKISYKVGQHALYMKSTGTIKRYGLQFLTPGAMYRAVDRLYPKWSRGHVSKTTLTGKGRADVVVSVRPGVREEHFQCENRLGIFEAIGNILTGQPAQVNHPTCMHRGDDACRYLISWREKSSAVWKRMGAYAGVLAIAVASWNAFFNARKVLDSVDAGHGGGLPLDFAGWPLAGKKGVH